MKINLLLTFDYELPLGGMNSSYYEALFKPTENLLKKSAELKVPIVLFADILSYVKFKTWDEINFAQPFKNQLQTALKQGHDVQLHIHPHWLETKYENQRFIPSEKFQLGDYDDEMIEDIIEKSIKELTTIGKATNEAYQCTAFRAGGYNLSPATSTILTSLYRHGIRYDSSICKGYFFSSAISKVDYRKCNPKCNWELDFNGDFFGQASKNGILEIPIAGKPKSLFEIPTSFKLKKWASRAVNHGYMIHIQNDANSWNRLRQLFSYRMLTVDNYTYTSDYLMDILHYNVKKYSSEKEIFISLIGHPKSMGTYALDLLEQFITKAKVKYQDDICFLTFQNIVKP